jgi:hypothetical protein
MVDGSNHVVGAYAGAPSSNLVWPQLIKYATKLMHRLHLNGEFSDQGASVRVGMDFGVRGAVSSFRQTFEPL